MRIAIIGKKHPFCGIVTYCRELIRALKAEGHTLAFYYLHNGEVHADNEDALPYVLKTHVYTVPSTDAKERLYASLRSFRPDVVHASYALSFLDLALPDLCARLDVPLVVTFHPAFDTRPSIPNGLSAMVYRLYARTLARCDRVVVFSAAQRDKLVHLGVPVTAVAIVPNGVDIRRYRPGASRFRAAIGAELLLTFMGRIDPEKNVGSLLEAFGHLEGASGVHLAVMGDGVLAPTLRQRYEQAPRVHWLGFVADERDRIDVLRGTDLFVLPSSVEGLSLALLEAMACGAVPVATDVGADGEVVAGCGRLLDPARLRRQLGPVLAALIADPAEVARLRERSRRRVVSRYAFDRNVNRLQQIYADAIGRRLRQAR